KRTKPRKVDLYDIFCALLYTLKNGCVWRDLPSDFPKWETVYYCWLLWTKTPSPAGITPLDKVLKKLSANIGWLKSVQFINRSSF
ncbi:transposase, partial [Lactiplantibacillus plantarum]|uniref:transposase n=1 Tax=Lactiplantibacillus plantarum TaxID=1590 RepID=UPI0020742F92